MKAVDSPVMGRLSKLERSLLGRLDLAAQQHDEIECYGDDYAVQLFGEVLARVMALRELWSCFPELRR